MVKNTALFSSLSGTPLASAKGLLILLIILGHNSILKNEYAIGGLYLFHVQCFMVLSVIFNKSPFRLVFIRDRAIRYLVPYGVFLVIYTILFSIMEERSVIESSQLFVVNLLRGNLVTLNALSGFQFLWFLPAIFSMILIHSVYLSLNWFGKIGIVGSSVCSLLWVCNLDPYWNLYGIFTASYYFPLALFIRWYMHEYSPGLYSHLVITSVALSSFICIAAANVSMNAGIPVLYGFNQPVLLACYIIFFPFWIVAILSTSKLYNNPCLVSLGNLSLIIYLVHQPIQVMFIMAVQKLGLMDGSGLGAVAYLVTVFIAWIGAYLLSRMGLLFRLIAPRDYKSWVEDIKILVPVFSRRIDLSGTIRDE